MKLKTEAYTVVDGVVPVYYRDGDKEWEQGEYLVPIEFIGRIQGSLDPSDNSIPEEDWDRIKVVNDALTVVVDLKVHGFELFQTRGWYYYEKKEISILAGAGIKISLKISDLLKREDLKYLKVTQLENELGIEERLTLFHIAR